MLLGMLCASEFCVVFVAGLHAVPTASKGIVVARVVINVMPKAEILDPQGQAVGRALGRIGVEGVTDVRQGKRFELEVADSVTKEDLEKVAEILLANTVIEDFEVVGFEVSE